MDAAFVGGLIVGAFVFTPLGMMLMGAFTSGAVEDAARQASEGVEDRVVRAYTDGFRNAKLQAAAESRGFAERAEARDRRDEITEAVEMAEWSRHG